ncbi:ATP synthase F1 subunit gamma [Mollicutes bacterium LVI A0039]|nr:ATP synthase F1 subunit gamma [Mollicutes bacterium LVI A0039]
MASLIESKRRVASVSTTQKVIKAMEMVASSKVKKARDKAKGVEFFFDATLDALASVYNNEEMRNSIFPPENDECTLVIAITSDMGLCGAYNSNVNKEVVSILDSLNSYKTIVVGKKGIGKLRYEGYTVDHSITDYSGEDEQVACDKIMEIVSQYLENQQINNIKIVYTDFVNPIVQIVKTVDMSELTERLTTNDAVATSVTEIEPGVEEVFVVLFEVFIGGTIYSTLLQSFASEHSFRRNSMEAANKNSLELIDKLNIEMNRIRQAMITQEITEIIGGSEVLNKE